MSARKPRLKQDTAAVLEYLRTYTAANHGMAPTVREMARACLMSVGQVIRQLDILQAHGLIVREEGRARGLYVVGDEDSADE